MKTYGNLNHGHSCQRRTAMLWSISLCLCLCLHATLALFPHGPEAGDTEITSDRSSLVSLSLAFPFYGANLSTMMIYRDAFICFDNTSRDLYLLEKNSAVNFPAIAVWASAVRTRHSGGVGSVTYRLTKNNTLLRQLSETARNFSEFASTFSPVYAVVITWLGVGTIHYEEVSREKINTFQVLLATDGIQSLVWMEYPRIEWIYDGPVALYDYNDIVEFTRAQVGFYKGDDTTKYLLPVSFTPSVREISRLSNVNMAGVYLFRIDTAPLNLTVVSANSSTIHSTVTTVQTTDDFSALDTSMSTVDTSTVETPVSTNGISILQTSLSINGISTVYTSTSSSMDNVSTVITSIYTDYVSTVQPLISSDDTPTVQTSISSDTTPTVQTSTLTDYKTTVPTSMSTDYMPTVQPSLSAIKISPVQPSVSTNHMSAVRKSIPTKCPSTAVTSKLPTSISTDSPATGSSSGATDHSVSDPIVGMTVVCVVLALMTVVALILVCRLQVKNRRKRFHSRKVGPEEPITAPMGNGRLQSAPTQPAPRLELHSASSVVSTAGVRVLDY